jgi:hypothetical protein
VAPPVLLPLSKSEDLRGALCTVYRACEEQGYMKPNL